MLIEMKFSGWLMIIYVKVCLIKYMLWLILIDILGLSFTHPNLILYFSKTFGSKPFTP